jgi:hypothetical protein
MQTIIVIFELPERESLNILVSFEFLNGIWVLLLSYRLEIQYPRVDKDVFIDVNS